MNMWYVLIYVYVIKILIFKSFWYKDLGVDNL